MSEIGVAHAFPSPHEEEGDEADMHPRRKRGIRPFMWVGKGGCALSPKIAYVVFDTR